MLFSLLKNEISQDDYLNYNDTTIIKVAFPRRIYGLIFSYHDRYFIIINKYISYYKQKKTILHELAHMELCHLDKKKLLEFKIEGLEDEADEYVKYLLKNIGGM